MGKIKEIRKALNIKVEPENILFFDMDGTLIDTDFANFLAYKNAIQSVTQIKPNILYNPNKRLNRGLLKKVVPNLTEIEYEKIIQQKEEKYKEYLPHTQLNKLVTDILIKYSETHKTVLVTNCREDRALITLNYHNLTHRFSNLFFRKFSQDNQKINKFQNAILSLEISPKHVIAYENEKNEIIDAINAGIIYINPIIKL